MEVTFKYSMIPDLLHPISHKHKLELSADDILHDANPRPLKRRKGEESEEEDEEMQDSQPQSYAELEKDSASLEELLGAYQELEVKSKAIKALLSGERQGNTGLQQDCSPLFAIVENQLQEMGKKIIERKSFYSLWLSSPRPLKLHLGYYGLLPAELIYSIFRFLDGKELHVLSQVCTLFHDIAQDESLWKELCERKWPVSIMLGQKPENRTWKWLYKSKTRTFRSGETRDGVGRFVLPYGNLYEGEWKADKRHGQGTGIMKDGRRYDGQWENDMRSGFGIFRWPLDCGANGGDTYVGDWKESKRHGQGIYTWVDGTKYDGQWGDGKREGTGCVVWPDGRKYVGEYKDGKMEGKGVFTWPDQSVYVGDYVNGKRHGRGKYTYSNGGIYEGEWEGGMRHGRGTLWKSTGEKYEGQWKYNAPHGLGTVTYKDGRQVEKQWIDDELLITP